MTGLSSVKDLVGVNSKCRVHIGSNKTLGCIFSEKSADWTNVFKLEISYLTYFYDMLLHGQVWVKNDSKVSGRIRKGDVVRAKSNRVREGNGGRFQGRQQEKENFCWDGVLHNQPKFIMYTNILKITRIMTLLPTRVYVNKTKTLLPNRICIT